MMFVSVVSHQNIGENSFHLVRPAQHFRSSELTAKAHAVANRSRSSAAADK